MFLSSETEFESVEKEKSDFIKSNLCIGLSYCPSLISQTVEEAPLKLQQVKLHFDERVASSDTFAELQQVPISYADLGLVSHI